MAISSALPQDVVSRTVGYKLEGIDLRETTGNLPMRIAIIGEYNFANHSTIDMTPKEIRSVKEAGDLYGYGSPIYQSMRILKPLRGGSISSIPIIVYPIVGNTGVQCVKTLTVTGTPTANKTHKLLINGRGSIDGQSYAFNVLTTDTPTTIATKIASAINGVSGSPVTATSSAGVVTITAKWKGITSNELSVETYNYGESVGITYAVASTTAGSGTPNISNVLSNWGNAWNTLVINPFGELIFNDLETLNGTPHLETATGQYAPTVFKPFVAFAGSTLATVSSLIAITGANARKTQVTNVIAPAPNSKGFGFEVASNMCYLVADVAHNRPHLDISNMSYPDMPVPLDLNIGEFSKYENRDTLAKNGCSTVDIVGGVYTIMEAVTTYRPDGDTEPQWRYVRAIIQDLNFRFGMLNIENKYVLDHVIANDSDIVRADKVIKPKQYIALLRAYADELERKGILVDSEFTKSSIQVAISSTNSNKLEVLIRYKRSGYARIIDITAQAGFNYGTV